jgi:hypothetical protein
MKNKIEILGIDLGNTIIKHRQVLPDAFRVIRRLIDERFGKNVHIVSRVTPEQEIRARAFVTNEQFQRELGIPLERVHFCRERHEKGPICEKIQATHFIDDRPEVMAHMPKTLARPILFDPTSEDIEAFPFDIKKIPIVRTWREVETLLLPTK